MNKAINFFLVMLIITTGMNGQEKSTLRFQVELYGGLGAVNPGDLNLALEAEKEMNYFYANKGYSYLESIDYINSFSYTGAEAYKRIKHVMPFGLRIKAYVGPTFALSLGIKYLTKTQRSYPEEHYTVIEKSGSTSTETIGYSPILLEMKGISIYAGLHIGRDLGRRFRIEGFLAAGSVSGEFIYFYTRRDDLYYGDSGLGFSEEISQEIRGKGRGLAIDGGVQLFLNLNEHFRVFLMGVYSYQKVKSLSGPAWQNIFGFKEKWDGEIFLIKEPHSEPWGNEEFTYPSNYEVLLEYFKDRNMRLDLSGFSINIGIAFRL